MHNGDTFALDVVRERYLRPSTVNIGSPEFTELLELHKERVYDDNIASAAKTQDPPPLLVGHCPAAGAARCETPWSELVRGGIETLHGTDGWGAKVLLDLLTKSLTANTYSNYEGKMRLVFVELCIDEEGTSPLDCTDATCVRPLAWIAERSTIGAGVLQPYLSTINTFLRLTGRDDAPVTCPAIIDDMKRALQLRQLTTNKAFRRATLPCNIIIDLDDLAALPTSTTDYGNILPPGAAMCSKFMVYSRGESGVSWRLHDMAGDAHNVTLFVNRENAGHRKRRDGLKPLQQFHTTAVPAWMRRFVTYRDATFLGFPVRQATRVTDYERSLSP
eukprot:jgi/Tetstr1/436032/TSEL_024911.t1